MAFPSESYYLAFGGPLGNSEEWSSGLRMTAAFAGDTQAEEVAALDAIEDAIATQWVAADTPIRNAAKLAWIKYNRIGVDGKYARPYTNVVDLPALLTAPGTTAQHHPLQITLVATLHTTATRGLANKGRMYLPAPKYAAEGLDSLLNPTHAAAAASWVAGLVGAINGATGSGDVHIMSKVLAGESRRVERVSVGNVFDTMRSRRGKLLEQRSESPVTTFGGTGGTF